MKWPPELDVVSKDISPTIIDITILMFAHVENKGRRRLNPLQLPVPRHRLNAITVDLDHARSCCARGVVSGQDEQILYDGIWGGLVYDVGQDGYGQAETEDVGEVAKVEQVESIMVRQDERNQNRVTDTRLASGVYCYLIYTGTLLLPVAS